jgi:cell division protein ZapA
MSNVTLQIGGRSYTVACADGQEDHIAGLGNAIDTKLASMGGGVQNESRTLLFAALLLADEVFELKNKAPKAKAGESGPDISPALETLATRLEGLAESLEA